MSTFLYLFGRRAFFVYRGNMTYEIKRGARNNRTDAERLQMIHDYAKANGAQCDATKAESMSGIVESIESAFESMMNPVVEAPKPPCVEEVFDTYIIAEVDDKYYSITYSMDENGMPVFAPREQWVEVEETYQAVKSFDPLVSFGEAVKATQLEDGNVKLGGYLVRFGDATKTDLTGDYFTKNTDFGEADKSASWFNHRMPVSYKKRQFVYDEQLPDAILTKDDIGVFAEIVLGARNEYEKMIAEMGLAGKLGWSSGTAPHLVDRKQAGNANEITRWHLGLDASLTPTPAEFRNQVVPLKSLSVNSQVSEAQAEQEKPESVVEPEIVSIKSMGENKMEIEETKLQEMLAQAAEAGATKAIAATEPVKSAGNIQVVTDEGDRPFGNIAEQVKAVIDFTKSYGRKVDPRLARLIGETKAVQGASEGVPSDGGILLEPTLSPAVIKPIHDAGPFSEAVNKLPVSTNSNSGWINGVDETSRVTGSRWGGMRGYRLAEGDTVTKSKPGFRRIQWELKKYGVLVYDTNELLKDAAQFSAIVEQGAREEIGFMLNDDIMNGIGVSGAQGFMNSGALITVTRDTGSKILGTDISAMWARMSPRSKANAKWFINPECGPQLDALFAVGSTAVLFPYAGYDSTKGVRTLYGKPVIETEFNAALNTTGDIVLADMSQYLLWEKGNVEMASSIHVEFLTDQEVVRFIYRADGQTALASALTPYKGTATRSPFVVLGSAT